MGYLHIDNLYKNQDVLAFRECYALEKVHGTSAWVSWKGGEITFYPGGASRKEFVELFDEESLRQGFEKLVRGVDQRVTVYGEAYGGKMQKMRETYGDRLRFIVFDVRTDKSWWNVEAAEWAAGELDLEFVPYTKVVAEWASLDAERDSPSEVARRRGVGDDKMREGIVIRPPFEVTKNNGKRVIAKHKAEAFSERRSKPPRDPEMRKILEDAEEVAREWVVPMRLTHVLDKLGNPRDLEKIPQVIRAMVEDVLREAEGEIVDTKHVRKAIGKEAVRLYKKLIRDEARERSA